MECGRGSHRQDQGRYPWVVEDEICSAVWAVGVWDAPFQWKGVDLSHSICNSRRFGKGRNTSPLQVDYFFTIEWVDLEVPQDPRNEGQVWGFFFLLELPKEMLRSWGVPWFPGTAVWRGSDSTRIVLGQVLLLLWVPNWCQWEGVGMCLSLLPGSYSLAGQQLRAGRGAHSFPTCCVSFDLVKSTLS